MSDRPDVTMTHPNVAERRWAAFDRVIGVALLIVAGGLFSLALIGFTSHLAGTLVHPDSVLLPLVVALILGCAGALFLLAAYAMRGGASGRWRAQWATLVLPGILLLFVWLSRL
jgi:hypothetical protein